MTPPYRGRFAPTPSGPLHLGSLQTAVASFLAAREQQGSWLLRLDDLDGPRCSPDAADTIQRQLEAHGLQWDESVYRQSDHRERYRAALDVLLKDGWLYRCDCSRAQLAMRGAPGRYGRIYGGRCREHPLPAGHSGSLRLRVPAENLGWDDAGCGRLEADLQRDIGDFVVCRRDQLPGYQLACALDEGAMEISEVVRGADLIGSTFCQQVVLRALQQPAPRYRHLPLRRDAAGRKLSKQNHAPPLQGEDAAGNLRRCLAGLGQTAPEPAAAERVEDVLAWAGRHWDPQRVPSSTLDGGAGDSDLD